MHVGSLSDVLAGRNIYEEPARGMWGILNQGAILRKDCGRKVEEYSAQTMMKSTSPTTTKTSPAEEGGDDK